MPLDHAHEWTPLIVEGFKGRLDTCHKCGVFQYQTVTGMKFALIRIDDQFAMCSPRPSLDKLRMMADDRRKELFPEEYLDFLSRPVEQHERAVADIVQAVTIEEETRYVCEGCGEVFKTAEVLKIHSSWCIG